MQEHVMNGLNDIKVKLSAAAVAFAMSAGTGLAQQGGAGQQSDEQTQQQGQGAGQSQSGSQQRGGQGAEQQSGAQQGAQQGGAQQPSQSGSQQGGAQQGQSASNQRQQGDSQLDRAVQMHSEIGTFVEALETAGLVEELAGNTQYTIFAPTNEAFESMQQDVAELLKPENRDDLVTLLRNHIVADDVDPQMARQLQAAQTLDGDTIEISTEGDKLKIGEASVVTPNIEVQGGNLRIYTIDKVLGDGRQLASSGRDRG
jgi:uncharacterized surface protein with fasciclin (FAS1) repeats